MKTLIKRFSALVLCLALLFCFCSCDTASVNDGKKGDEAEENAFGESGEKLERPAHQDDDDRDKNMVDKGELIPYSVDMNAGNGSRIVPQMVYIDDDFEIAVKGIDYLSSGGYSIFFDIKNKTDEDIPFGWNAYCNDIEVRCAFEQDAAANAVTEYDFLISESIIEMFGIEDICEFSFIVATPLMPDIKPYDSGWLTVRTDSDFEQGYDPGGKLICDDEGVKIYMLGYSVKSDLTCDIELFVDARNAKSSGEPVGSVTVNGGEKTVDNLVFSAFHSGRCALGEVRVSVARIGDDPFLFDAMEEYDFDFDLEVEIY